MLPTHSYRPLLGRIGAYIKYLCYTDIVYIIVYVHIRVIFLQYNITTIYVPVPSFANAGVPPMVWSHHGRQGPPTVLCWQQLHEQTAFYNPVYRTLHSTRGKGKMMMMMMMMMMMCVWVDIACVFYMSSWYVPCVL